MVSALSIVVSLLKLFLFVLETRSIQHGDEVGDSTSVSQDNTKHSPSLSATSLFGENRFDYHMFGCDCHPVMDCVHDSDCRTSKGQDYYCEFRCCAFKCVHISQSDDEAVVDNVATTEPQSVEDIDVIANVISDDDHDEKDEENIKAETDGNHSEPDVIPDVFNVVDKLPNDNVNKDVYDVNVTLPTDSFSDTDNESAKADVDETNEGIMNNGKYPIVYDYNVDIIIDTRDQMHNAKTKNNIDKHTSQGTKKDTKINSKNEASGNVKKQNDKTETAEQDYKRDTHNVGNRVYKQSTRKNTLNEHIKNDGSNNT